MTHTNFTSLGHAILVSTSIFLGSAALAQEPCRALQTFSAPEFAAAPPSAGATSPYAQVPAKDIACMALPPDQSALSSDSIAKLSIPILAKAALLSFAQEDLSVTLLRIRGARRLATAPLDFQPLDKMNASKIRQLRQVEASADALSKAAQSWARAYLDAKAAEVTLSQCQAKSGELEAARSKNDKSATGRAGSDLTSLQRKLDSESRRAGSQVQGAKIAMTTACRILTSNGANASPPPSSENVADATTAARAGRLAADPCDPSRTFCDGTISPDTSEIVAEAVSRYYENLEVAAKGGATLSN